MEKELDLVRQAKAGDVNAFAKLYEQVYEDMYRYAFYMLQHTQDAQDAVSDTVADAFASIRKLRGEEAFRGWIFAILANKCRRKRKEYVNRPMELMEQLGDPEENGPTIKKSSEAEHAVIRQLFFSLPEEDREIIALHLFAGYTSKEIAKKLHMNENTVRSKESRALKKLVEQYW